MAETEAKAWWDESFVRGGDSSVDYQSRDGATVIQVKPGVRSLREVHAEILRLATMLDRSPAVQHACLVLVAPRVAAARLLEEWSAARRVLVRSAANRLAVVIVGEDLHVAPDASLIRRIGEHFRDQLVERGPDDKLAVRECPKFYAVVKTLLVHWLNRHPPTGIGALATEVGCSHPTLREALARLDAHHCLARSSNRSVELRAFPVAAWRELLALGNMARPVIRFIDATGSRPDPWALVSRLKRRQHAELAVGGVLAARHWHPAIDLNGAPRLDLSLHVTHGNGDLAFVRRLDRGLQMTDDPSAPAALVVHPLHRAASLFAPSGELNAAVADPVETALDLFEMGLSAQAEALLVHFRKEARPR